MCQTIPLKNFTRRNIENPPWKALKCDARQALKSDTSIDLHSCIEDGLGLGGRRTLCFSDLKRRQPDLPADGLRDLLSHLVWPAQPREIDIFDPIFNSSSDLVDDIAYSSGLGGCRTSCFSVLERRQPDLPADGLRDLLGHLVGPAQPREVDLFDPIFKLWLSRRYRL